MLPSYNPMRIAMGSPGTTGVPYAGTPTNTARKVNTPPQAQPGQSQTVGAQSVTATGLGPFDPAYRQNLATFAGGQFARPGGSLQFNPTGLGQGFGAPTGGGNAPLPGMPNTLLGQAQGGQPLVPQTQALQAPTQAPMNPNNFWLEQFLKGGQGFGFAPPTVNNVNQP